MTKASKPKVTIAFSADPEMRDKVNHMAKMDNRSVSNFICLAITNYIESLNSEPVDSTKVAIEA